MNKESTRNGGGVYSVGHKTKEEKQWNDGLVSGLCEEARKTHANRR